MKRVFLFVPLIGFLVLGLLFFLTIDRENKDVLPSPLVGQPFPEFQMTTLLDNQPVSLAQLKGKPLLVNVWATWCPTCKAEHSFLNLLAAEGVRIVGINYKDEQKKAHQWLTGYGNPYEFNIFDPDGKLGLDLGVYGAPETFLVDSKGIIRAKHVGDLNADVWRKLEATYRGML
jgi:cytochrome c biogenesis protein CcmG/thiol:disulfide interchange protein DsbE